MQREERVRVRVREGRGAGERGGATAGFEIWSAEMTALPLRRSDRSNSGLGEVRWGPLRFTARAGPGLELTVR